MYAPEGNRYDGLMTNLRATADMEAARHETLYRERGPAVWHQQPKRLLPVLYDSEEALMTSTNLPPGTFSIVQVDPMSLTPFAKSFEEYTTHRGRFVLLKR